uniref:CCHC-type domain-containing protein n=1 Tax=Noccaea caerulescens TaxID=107243 RepID=A0A1J3GK41_NOCCA
MNLPSIEDVFNMVAQDERQKSIKPSSRQDNVVFHTSGPADQSLTQSFDSQGDHSAFATQHQHGYRPKQRSVCTHCGQLGHIVQKCFKLHGYPPGHKFHNPTGQQQSSFVPRGQQNSQPRHQSYHKTNTVANVMTGSSLYMPPWLRMRSTLILVSSILLNSRLCFNNSKVM